MSASILELRPELVWGLFTRGLGLILLISFTSLIGQVKLGAGRLGGLPVAIRLAKMKRDFPTWRRFYYFPTLLWLNDSDGMLQLITAVGIASSAYVVYGGPYAFAALLTCYVAYLSLDMAVGLIFPWDSLLFEATVLGLFLPATHSLPDLSSVSAPAPALAWAYRLLVFRVMFGFGKQKFIGSTSKDLAYLKGFLIAQPLPSPLGWYAHKQPTILLKPLVLFMMFAEIPSPFFALIPGWLSLVSAATTTFLMVGIQIMGSFGYFSLLTIVSCIPLLDNITPRALHVTELFSAGAPVFTNAFLLIHTLSASVAFLFNSWVGQSWHLWSAWYRLPRLWQLPFDFFRALHPFRWLHPYGVFPPNTGPDVKMSLLAEVSWDEKEWHELVFHFSPTRPQSPPKFVAPYHPRGDQAVIYETFGLNPTSLISSMVGPWDPYSFGARSGADVLCQRLLEGHGLKFLQSEALAQHAEPPISARISTIMLEPLPLKEHFATGNWWKRTYVGPHAPPRRLEEHFWEDFLPEPEMWHFDAIFWRRRSRLKSLMDRALDGREDPMALAIVESDGELSPEYVEQFWNEFIPSIADEERKSFDTLPDVVGRARSRFSRLEQRAFARLLGRFSMILVARLEPHYLNLGLKPAIPAQTYFHLWMAAQHLIGTGREAYLAALAAPLSVTDTLPHVTSQTGLYLMSIFRFEQMTFEAQKLRLIACVTPPHDPEAKANYGKNLDELTNVEKKFAALAQTMSGFFCVMPEIKESFKGPGFDHGFPELYPTFVQVESGAVHLRTYKAPPVGSHLPGMPSSQPAE